MGVDVLAELATGRGPVLLRRAVQPDVAGVVALLAEDPLGAAREAASSGDYLLPYVRAFAAVDADPAHLLVVAVTSSADSADSVGGAEQGLAATMQLSFLPGLARRGALRAQVEAVHVAAAHRGSGLGSAMLTWAVAESRRRGCALVQLTSDKRRRDAHRFYARLGFTASHEGFKLLLD